MSLRSRLRALLRRHPPEAPVLQESPTEAVAICEHDAWHGFMLEVLYPDAVRLTVAPGEPASQLLAAIPRTVRGVLIHLNASYTRGFIDSEDELRAGLEERGQRVLNAGAVDVRKSTLHACYEAHGWPSPRASREGPPDERLIVKTVLNFGGRPERALRARYGERAAAFTRDLTDAIPGHLDYRVATRRTLPASVWSDPGLVVERFIENPEGIFLRVYVVGPAGVVSVVTTPGDIKKLSTGIRRRHNYYFWTLPAGDTVPLGPSTATALEALTLTRRLAARMGIDFVGADCVLDGGGGITVVDLNKTPYWGQPRQSPILSHLRHGFNALIGHFT